MMKLQMVRNGFLGVLVLITVGVSCSSQVYAQGGKKSLGGKICSDPTAACKTSATFESYDLPFQIPKDAVIWESVDFYAIILSSVAAPDVNCEAFIPEEQRLEAQSLFPKTKVFASRCTIPGGLYYTNVAPNQQFMAVYAGATKTEANRMLATVKATGKFPQANIRRMRTGFNGT